MGEKHVIEHSARSFTSEDIELIRWTRKHYPALSRGELASTVCEFLDWTTDAGRPKTVPCLRLLEKLEEDGIITLPAVRKSKEYASKGFIVPIKEPESEITGTLADHGPISLVLAETTEARNRFHSYVEAYHMLGYKKTFGSRLFYFIASDSQELGCMQFSASSWALQERDKWIGWTEEDRRRRLHLIVNNSRFLIFPWVHIPNLASHALSLAARRIVQDYMRVYLYEPVLLETFVDAGHFAGTCYKAANWKRLGQTSARGRTGRRGDASVKDIYVYPLRRDFRKCLTGEREYRRGDPDHDL